ncbi:MerR family transcriptional regulator [Candidatus Enterococcus willemsii]|uniref:MerR family transcriptional regulator n=1 Tax=Candidatus Enterococcus willemsii TaxID=1857215 RepID=A0ABQ6Z114_9ENTE|nr:MerR family transcriptional regulator [Enterococcus sp. CU12B]KAF1305070.1 MerR family transcriptional regulator [Enterococcus sp. CU12B]
MNYTIGEFARLTGLSIDTLRYYEKEALIKPERNTRNQRVFTEKDVQWVRFILRLKQIGMPIKEMKTYAKLREEGDDTIVERIELLYQQQQSLHEQKAVIENHLNFLSQKIETYQEMLKNNA